MKKQGYGRFVFISSSAGMFGQHLESHYAAAKAGLVGLTNVIALEGAPHGILANTVLPSGFSRMVTETVGDTDSSRGVRLPQTIEPELVTPMVVYLASRACEFSHRNYSAIGGRYARVFIGLGEGWIAERGTEPDGRRRRRPPRRDLGDREVHRSRSRSTKRSSRSRERLATASPPELACVTLYRHFRRVGRPARHRDFW